MNAPIPGGRGRCSPSAPPPIVIAACAVGVLLAAGPAASRAAPASLDPVFPISHLDLRYADDGQGLPDPQQWLPLEVALRRTGEGLAAAPRGATTSSEAGLERVSIGATPTATPLRLHASGLSEVLSALVRAAQEEGLVGIFVAPDGRDIDLQTERDRRPRGETALRVVISVGRVRSLRSVAVGERVDANWQVDNPVHRTIRTRSPVHASDALRPGQTDVLRRDELEAYLFRLNRRPGRRVSAALSASDDGGIALDYRVAEAKPWYVYAQVADTGSERTDDIQTTFGFVHNQLTDNDDTLQLRYTNGGLDDLHAVHASYEAPWFGPERPGWLRDDADPTRLDSWFSRDWIPWWGTDRLRWLVSGGWSRFKATDIAFTDDFESVDWNAGWQVFWSAFQHRALFVDLVGGMRARVVSVENEAFGRKRSELLLLPQVGLRLDRVTEVSSVRGSLIYERNVSSAKRRDLELLGRRNVDDDFQVLRYDLGASVYLEPLLRGDAWRDPSTPWSSTLAHEVALGSRGQFAFGDRLIPQFSQVAGGLLSVRGYPQSTAIGDTVHLWSAEYRFHIPRSLPVDAQPLQLPGLGNFRTAPQHVYGRPDWDLILRAFVDVGRTIRHDRFLDADAGSAFSDDEKNATLIGAGLGLELRLRQYLTARVDWARALRDSPRGTGRVEAGSDEIHFLVHLLF